MVRLICEAHWRWKKVFRSTKLVLCPESRRTARGRLLLCTYIVCAIASVLYRVWEVVLWWGSVMGGSSEKSKCVYIVHKHTLHSTSTVTQPVNLAWCGLIGCSALLYWVNVPVAFPRWSGPSPLLALVSWVTSGPWSRSGGMSPRQPLVWSYSMHSEYILIKQTIIIPSPCRHPDMYVRSKGVEWLTRLNNDDLCDLLPQLVQVRMSRDCGKYCACLEWYSSITAGAHNLITC